MQYCEATPGLIPQGGLRFALRFDRARGGCRGDLGGMTGTGQALRCRFVPPPNLRRNGDLTLVTARLRAGRSRRSCPDRTVPNQSEVARQNPRAMAMSSMMTTMIPALSQWNINVVC